MQDLIEEYGLPTVQAYMHHIQVLISEATLNTCQA